jgi:CheY-like chemotaxis protein
MNSLALHRQPAPTFCVLAVEPDANQALVLEQSLEGRIHGKLTVVSSLEAALEALGGAIPDLVLVSPLLPARTEDRLIEHLRALGVDASHLQLLSIPRFGNEQAQPEKKRTFGSLMSKTFSSGQPGDPVASAFADDVAAHLARLSGSMPKSLPKTPPVDQEAGVRLSDLEHLLDRLHPEEQPEAQLPEVQLAESPLPEAQLEHEQTPIEEPFIDQPGDVMPTAVMPTGQEPRFLTPDPHISAPLRAVLDEADGCLRMAFLTGGGACAVRALDLLLTEQGIVGTDRAHSLRELGKKHPAVAEAFLRMLLQVMSDSSALWEIKRLTLAIVLLKAVAHEIYVLGPERTERASYVLALVERFNAGIKSGGSAA